MMNLRAALTFCTALAAASPAAADRPVPGEGRIAFDTDERLALPLTPWDMEAGDLDGDGHTDLIAATDDGLAILMGSAEGLAPVVMHAPAAAYRLLAAELDGDDAAELLSSRDSHLQIWRWKSGQLIEVESHQTEEWPSSIAAADLDNDGDRDVIIALSLANKVATFLNDGTGRPTLVSSFDVGVTDITPFRLMRVAAADMNGDGLADVVATDTRLQRVVIFPGLGDGRLGVPTGIEAPQSSTPTTTVLALGDLDGDGDTDIALGEDGIQVLLNEGGFFRHLEFRTSLVRALEDILMRDIDDDGFTDIVVLNRSFGDTESNITVLNGPIGESPRARAYIAAPRPTALVAADVDADGDDDVVVSSPDPHGGGTISILRNRGNGRLASISRLPVPDISEGNVSANSSPLAVIELDSGPGLVLRSGSTGYLVRNDGRGWFHGPERMADGYPAVIEDLSGDGHADILVPAGPGEWSLMLGDGTGRFTLAGSVPAGAVLGDADGDGLRDLIYAFQTGDLEFRPNRGGGAFGAPQALGTVPAASRATARLFANLDGHRGDELVLGLDGPLRADTVEVWTNWHGRELREPVRVSTRAPGGCCGTDNDRPIQIEQADLDGDGREDLIMFGRSVTADGYIATFRNAGRGEWRGIATIHAGKEAAGMVVADFDLDASPDVAVAEISSSTSGRTRVLRGLGDGNFEDVTTYFPGDYPFAIAAADFDMDGRTDLAVWCGRLEVLAVHTNASETPQPQHVVAPVLGAEAVDGVVRVQWSLSPSLHALMQRAEIGRHWQDVGIAQVTQAGSVELVDPNVQPGRRYGYRLASTDPRVIIDGSEAWVKLQPQGGIIVHELAPGDGTADAGAPVVETSEPGDGTVEVFDLGGRRVASARGVRFLAGPQRVRVPGVETLGQGVYWVRVMRGPDVATGRVVVLR